MSSPAEGSNLRRGNRLQTDTSDWVRKSVRDPSISLLDKRDVKTLIKKIHQSRTECVILKIKDHLLADINTGVVDSIIGALWTNRNCQALYMQNLTRAFGDTQLHALVELLKKKTIWCLNVGELYDVSNEAWIYFCDSLSKTSITHLYVSEHVISLDLKNKMRFHIRENRKKHELHCSPKNIRIIERCTNMWW